MDYVTAAAAHAERILTDTATIVRPGAPSIDPVTLAATRTTTTITTCARCLVSNDLPADSNRTVEHQELDVSRTRIRFPLGQDVAAGDLVTVTCSLNAGLVSTVFTVDSVQQATMGPLLNVFAEHRIRRD